MQLPVGRGAYKRAYANSPEVKLVNRFFEQNPSNLESGQALVSRPPTLHETSVGDGPVRYCFSQPGLFDEDLFIVSGNELFRYDGTNTEQILGFVAGSGGDSPRMAVQSGTGYQRLFIADGASLQFYGRSAYGATLTHTSGTIADDVVVIDNVHFQFASSVGGALTAATGTLSQSGPTHFNDTIIIDQTHYRFTEGGLSAGNGTSTAPYIVKAAQNNTALAMTNLYSAINATGTPGINYGSGVSAHPTVTATSLSITSQQTASITVTAKTPGPDGNAIATSVIFGNNATDGFSWGGVVLSGGSASAPDGSSGNPYLVLVPGGMGSDAAALLNLRRAINANGTPGTDYSSNIVNSVVPRVIANANTATTVSVRAVGGDTPSPAIAVSVSTTSSADGLAWSSANLVDTGVSSLNLVDMPDGVGASSVTTLNGFVLVSVTGSQRVYFLRPGEIAVDPLDFFEAESEPDALVDLITVGDQVWCIGQSSTDVYYPTGDNDAPFARAQGRPFSRGALAGTVVKLADSVFLVGDDNIIYRLTGGPEPISDYGMSERIRLMRTETGI